MLQTFILLYFIVSSAAIKLWSSKGAAAHQRNPLQSYRHRYPILDHLFEILEKSENYNNHFAKNNEKTRINFRYWNGIARSS